MSITGGLKWKRKVVRKSVLEWKAMDLMNRWNNFYNFKIVKSAPVYEAGENKGLVKCRRISTLFKSLWIILFFLATSYLVVTVQSYMEWNSLKKMHATLWSLCDHNIIIYPIGTFRMLSCHQYVAMSVSCGKTYHLNNVITKACFYAVWMSSCHRYVTLSLLYFC